MRTKKAVPWDGPPYHLRQPPAGLHLSASTKADSDLAIFDDDRNLTHPLGKLQHLLQGLFFLLDIDISGRDISFGVFLPGRRGKGSPLFPVDQNLLCHNITSPDFLSTPYHTQNDSRCNSDGVGLTPFYFLERSKWSRAMPKAANVVGRPVRPVARRTAW